MHLKKDILALERNIPVAHKKAATVSAKPIDWHIDHSLRVINKTCESLIRSEPVKYKWRFNWWRLIIFTWGKFPRGKVRAPDYVLPEDHISTKDMYVRLRDASELLKKINKLHRNAYIHHPYFGSINRKQSVKFLKIHTKHHLRIIKDIKRAQ